MKVLLLSHNCFSSSSNNGKTLKNIFSSFRKDEVCQLFFSDSEEPDFNVCENYFYISDVDILTSFLRKKNDVGRIITNNSKQIIITSKKRGYKIINYIKKKKSFFFFFRNWFWQHSKWNSPKLKEWINSQKPDLIFFLGGNYTFSHKIAYEMSNGYNIPLVVYFTDDYILYPEYKGILGRYYKKSLINSSRKTLSKSICRFTIGELMAKEYSSFFDKDFGYIMNCVEFKPKNDNEHQHSWVKISYFGSLHSNRYQSIIQFAQLLKKLEPEFDYKYKIYVYTHSRLENNIIKQFEEHNVALKQPIFGEELERAITSSTFLLHVESVEKKYRKMTRLSISTKIPEYLISGRPIIAFGPSEVASIRLISDNNIGLVIDPEKNDENINKSLLSLIEVMNSEDIRRSYSKNGYNFALENFLKENIANKFYKTLNDHVPVKK